MTLFALLGGLLWLGDLLTWTSAIGVLVLCGLIHLLLRRPIRAWNLAIGALVAWAIFTIVIGFMIPGASYLLVWPLLFALIPAAWALRHESETSPTLADASLMAICAIPAVLWFSGLAYLFYNALGISLVGAPIALVGLLLALLIPQIEVLTARRPWILPSCTALAGILLLLVATIGAEFDERHRRPTSLWYALDADSGEAVWQSSYPRPDDWSATYLGTSPASDDIAEFIPSSPARVLSAVAPPTDLKPPEVTLVEESTQRDGRVLTLRVVSTRRAPMINVFVSPGSRIVAVRVNDQLVETPHDKSAAQDERWWRWRYYAPPTGGFELKLKTDTADPLELRVTDFSFGFPAFADLPPRPAGSMPAPYTLSDMTLVTRRFSF